MTTAARTASMTRPARAESRLSIKQGLQLIALAVILLVILFPVFWMITTSLKVQNDTFAIPPKLLSFEPTLQHYNRILEEGEIIPALVNSIVIAGGATLLAVILGTPAAYVLARFEFKHKKDLWFWFISQRFISPIVVVLPFFLIAKDLKALDTQWFLILVYQTFSIPLVVWLCLDQFRSIPRDIDDAAKVDGCNLAQTFFRINLPLALPGIVVSSILSFIFAWNEMLFALLLAPNKATTAPVQATTFMTGMGIRWGDMMATGTLIVLPVIIFAALVSRHLVRGLTMGAVK